MITSNMPYSERLKKAHEAGHLFVHMFEVPVETFGHGSVIPLFDVMAGKPNARYKNDLYHMDFPTTPYGIVGLATTALNAEYPIRVFTDQSHVGVLMDSARPVFVSSNDAASTVTGDKIMIQGVERCAKLRPLQGMKTSDRGFNMMKDIQERFTMADSALQAFWDYVKEIGWEKYSRLSSANNPSMNEVNVAANLHDICGIVISQLGEMEIRTAIEIKAYLESNYPEFSKDPLPIMFYDISRNVEMGSKGNLVELSEERIQDILTGKTVKEVRKL